MAVVNNGVTAVNVIIDGAFTGGVQNGKIVGEWADVAPLAFHSPTSPTDTFRATTVGSIDTNSLLYVAIDKGGDDIYLMYDYGPSTPADIVNLPVGAEVGEISFPLQQTKPDGTQLSRLIDVIFSIPNSGGEGGGTSRNAAIVGGGGASLDVSVRFEDTGELVPATSLGMTGVAGIHRSTLPTTDHLMLELSVPLSIPAGFASPGSVLPAAGEKGAPVGGGEGGGTNFFGYSPDPAFWGASIVPGGQGGGPNTAARAATRPGFGPNGLAPASSALFQINPNGSVRANSTPLITQVVSFDIQGNSKLNPFVLEGKGELKDKDLVFITVRSTANFDATKISLNSVKLTDASDSDDSARPISSKVVDGNLVLAFRWGGLEETLSRKTKTLSLTGKTTDGTSFGGTQRVYMVWTGRRDHDRDND